MISCNKPQNNTAAVAKGSRHLGIHITPAQGQDYGKAYLQARSVGADCIPFTLQWSELETNGTFDTKGLLNDLNGFYSTQPVSISLCVSPIVANRRDVPADLFNTAFDDPTMIQRFESLLDTIHQHVSASKISYLLIGNEVDNYFSLHRAEWPAYARFCAAVRIHARALWGAQLLVGSETTLGGNLGADIQDLSFLNGSMDVICLTYYPLTDSFTMRPVTTVNADFDKIFNLYAGRRILFQEVGYATSIDCLGSDSAQALFVKEIFRIWDKHTNQIPFMAFL